MQTNYQCSQCQKTFSIEPDLMVCPDCSQKQKSDEPLRGVLEVRYQKEVGKDFDLYQLLPVEKEFFPPIPVGNTPLWQPLNLRSKYQLPRLFIKDDGVNPTGSFKDRASVLVAAFAKKYQINDITLASTGNAGSSMAGVGAAAGLNITLFLPEAAPKAKMIQALQYGARVILVRGNYDKAYDLSLEYSRKVGGLNRSTAYNPMTLEGKKTVSLEIFKQLEQAPDYIFVPTGDGCILGGVYKGFQDLLQIKLISKMPTIFAVQATGSNAIARAFKNKKFDYKSSTTVADSISVDIPRNGYYALAQLQRYQGSCITVTDQEILQAQVELSQSCGLFSEPAGATSFAGLKKISNQLDPKSSIVLLATGNGLKDTVSALKGIKQKEIIIDSLDDII